MTTNDFSFSLEFDREAVANFLKRIDIAEALVDGMKQAGVYVEGRAVKNSPVNKNTAPGQTRGRLSAGWTTETSVRSGNILTRVGNNVFYGPFVNDGTGVYAGGGLIRPRGNRPFPIQTSDGLIFRWSIRGQPGQHFVEKTARESRVPARNIVTRRLRRALET